MDIFMGAMGPGIGLFLGAGGPVKAMNRSGAATAVGQLMQFDFEGVATESTGVTPGTATYPPANVIDMTAGGIAGTDFTVYCVAMEIAADNAQVTVEWLGRIPILSKQTTGGTVNPFDPCTPADGFVEFDGTVTGPIVGAYHAAAATLSSTAILKEVFLLGTRGLFAASIT